MKNLLISGNTLVEWDINSIIAPDAIISSKSRDIERMIEYHWENKIGQYCNDMTYLQIEQLNNTYNNF